MKVFILSVAILLLNSSFDSVGIVQSENHIKFNNEDLYYEEGFSMNEGDMCINIGGDLIVIRNLKEN